MRSYAILGTGAIGGYCAVKLHLAGFPVHCLLGRDYAVVRREGLTLIEGTTREQVMIWAYADVQEIPKCDVVVVALKTTMNGVLKAWLLLLMHPHSVVLVLQNGLGVESGLAEFVRAESIVGGACSLIVSKRGPGVLEHVALNEIAFAQYYPEIQAKGISFHVEQIASDLLCGRALSVSDTL